MRAKDPSYSAYARHYDQIGQSKFGERSSDHLLAHLNRAGFTPESVLDLACGTGAATIPFARLGMKVSGLDRSPDMLAIASNRAAVEKLDITWLYADMRDFALERQVDLCTCFYDAVNYLDSLAEIGAMAERAFAAIRPGGYFAFDINTRRKLAEHWQDSTVVAADTDDRYIVYQSWFDEVSGASPLIVNLFERAQDGTWNRFVEEHIEHAFAIADVVVKLRETGFEPIRVLDWREGDPGEAREGTENSFRVLFLAQRAKEQQ